MFLLFLGQVSGDLKIMLSNKQQEIIKSIAGKYNPSLLGVFGSYARNEQTASSDLDLLIEFDDVVNLLELIGLEQELSEKLGVKVDLVTKKSLSKHLKPYIEKDFMRII